MEEKLCDIEKQMKMLVEESKAAREESKKTQEQVSTLRSRGVILRRGILEDRRIESGKQPTRDREPTTVRARNAIAHGGDILGDIDAIQYVPEQELPHASEYKQDFRRVYGIEFDKANAEIQSYPLKLIEIFNTLASVRELYEWQQGRHRADRTMIEQLATEIIGDASKTESNQLLALFNKEGILFPKCQQVAESFMAANELPKCN